METNMLANLSQEEFADLKQIMTLLLVEILADDPDSIIPVLQEFCMDRAGAEAIADLMEHFNTYSPEIRRVIIEEILQVLKYENGQFRIDWSEVPSAVIKAGSIIVETILTNPQNIGTIFEQLRCPF